MSGNSDTQKLPPSVQTFREVVHCSDGFVPQTCGLAAMATWCDALKLIN